ncbi:hypothetical protein Vadar_018117 [Vaccinium darrowii]|uniref:Uncharacterized protein n=1 Tax=Vaccinium darrowii TaxID=229202 RepID=A0ACB7Z4M3_9ERIC|nr:hypothetical protein Vadar_018117 [Vaccinium darrowii]
MVALKSLKSLKQEGEKQFRAEVSTLGMIQHINLVHLRGFCIEERRNSDISEDGCDEYFPFWVATKIKEGGGVIMTLLDYRSEGNCDVEELKWACKVACWCIQDDEKDRPTMGQVVQILKGVSEVGIPPFTPFIQGLADSQTQVPFDLQPIPNSSTLLS